MLSIIPHQSAPQFVALNNLFSPVSRRTAWRGLDQLADPFDSLFESLLGPSATALTDSRFSAIEDDSGYEFVVALPGFAREEVEVEVGQNNHLTVTARHQTSENAPKRADRAWGGSSSVTRSITLPSDVQPDSATAKLENGILTVTVGKALTPPPKRITVS
jgi:HSP20 family protein